MEITLNPSSIDDYRTFLAIKRLPTYRMRGRTAIVPDEYADMIGATARVVKATPYAPPDWMFDYQRAICDIAIRKRKYCIFAEPGLGKTNMMLEWARHAQECIGRHKGVLLISPLMVVPQTLDECRLFFGDSLAIETIKAADLPGWTETCAGKIGITNYEALSDDVQQGSIGAIALDESSMLKSHYGEWGGHCIRLGRGLEWKLSMTGTPAPNDRIEFANQAMFMDAVPTVNSFLATYFVNRGETANRWELKPHALKPFYRALSHFSIFLANPATYGWKDNTADQLPPINVNLHDVPLTHDQKEAVGDQTGAMFVHDMGGIGTRQKFGQIAKGHHNGKRIETNKPGFIRDLISGWKDTESTLVWCIYNDEQDRVSEVLAGCASMTGETPLEDRLRMIADFKARRVTELVTKGKILGFGQNLQVATRQVFSGLQDSYETYWQCVKRSNRVGSKFPLNVHVPITDIEEPMVRSVLVKAARVQQDTLEQEAIFKEFGCGLEV